MPDAVKPEICLTGKLLYPVHIGLPEYIQERLTDTEGLPQSVLFWQTHRKLP